MGSKPCAAVVFGNTWMFATREMSSRSTWAAWFVWTSEGHPHSGQKYQMPLPRSIEIFRRRMYIAGRLGSKGDLHGGSSCSLDSRGRISVSIACRSFPSSSTANLPQWPTNGAPKVSLFWIRASRLARASLGSLAINLSTIPPCTRRWAFSRPGSSKTILKSLMPFGGLRNSQVKAGHSCKSYGEMVTRSGLQLGLVFPALLGSHLSFVICSETSFGASFDDGSGWTGLC